MPGSASRCDVTRGDEQVQCPGSPAIRQVQVQSSLTAAKGAEFRHCTVQADTLQQAFHNACGLSKRQAKQYLHCRAGLDRGITETVPPTALAARRRHPDHIRIKPDQKRSSPPQRCILRRPVPGLILRRGSAAHAAQLSCAIHGENPPCDLCNKANAEGSQSRKSANRRTVRQRYTSETKHLHRPARRKCGTSDAAYCETQKCCLESYTIATIALVCASLLVI